MPLKFGALLIVIGCSAALGIFSLLEENKISSQEAVKPIAEIVEINGEKEHTNDQEVFLLEQQTQEGVIVESGSTESQQLGEPLEESPRN
jgi:hypothetical protein